MEKIILVLNAQKPSLEAIDFACSIAEITQSSLTGIFIENIYYQRIKKETEGNYFLYNKHEDTIVTVDTDQSIRIFKEQCQKKAIAEEVIIDTGEPIQKIIFESRFSDLMIMEPDLDFYDREQDQPSDFLKTILIQSECPIVLSPLSFSDIEEIVFCFDGDASSVYTAKQFTYLFPQLSNKPVRLLEVKSTENETFSESERRMMNWLRSHYRTVHYQVLTGNVKDELIAHFFMKQNKIIIMGAYGRSILSNLFHKSEADPLIRDIDLPLFITHY